MVLVQKLDTEILLKIAQGNAPPILEELPRLPPPIAAVIDRSLRHDLTERFRSDEYVRPYICSYAGRRSRR